MKNLLSHLGSAIMSFIMAGLGVFIAVFYAVIGVLHLASIGEDDKKEKSSEEESED
jgi:hypothetical protein